MFSRRLLFVCVIAAIGSGIACGSSPTTPAPAPRATIAIVGLTASVEALTTSPQPGLAYRLTYQLRESGGRLGATAVSQHFAFSNGATADGNFNSAQAPPHVSPGGSITISSTYSVFPASVPATHVVFSITYTDDGGQSGTVTAEADIARSGS